MICFHFWLCWHRLKVSSLQFTHFINNFYIACIELWNCLELSTAMITWEAFISGVSGRLLLFDHWASHQFCHLYVFWLTYRVTSIIFRAFSPSKLHLELWSLFLVIWRYSCLSSFSEILIAILNVKMPLGIWNIPCIINIIIMTSILNSRCLLWCYRINEYLSSISWIWWPSILIIATILIICNRRFIIQSIVSSFPFLLCLYLLKSLLLFNIIDSLVLIFTFQCPFI